MTFERPPYALHPVTIKRCRRVTPHMKRITIDASFLTGLRDDLPTQWFKVFVAQPDGQRSSGRAYTVRRFDPLTGEVDIDFVLHGDTGPVSAWADRAHVGDVFEVSDVHPRSGFAIDPAIENYVLFGDETALPAISAILEALPPYAIAWAFIDVANADDKQELASEAALTVTWLLREGVKAGESMSLESAARAVRLPERATTIWAAAESGKVAALRRLFLKERGVERGALHATGYWKRGEADHRDEEG